MSDKLDELIDAVLFEYDGGGPSYETALKECPSIMALKSYVSSLEAGWWEQLDIMWDRRDAAEDALDGAYDTISDLLDQIARVRARYRSLVAALDTEIEDQEHAAARHLACIRELEARAETAERERDEARTLQMRTFTKLAKQLAGAAARASLWKRAAREYRERAQQTTRLAKDTEWELTRRLGEAVCDVETFRGLLRSERRHTTNLTEHLATVERERDEAREHLGRVRAVLKKHGDLYEAADLLYGIKYTIEKSDDE